MSTVLLQQGGAGFWALILHSSLIAQVVLLILVGFSIFSWAIIFKKWRFYNHVAEQSSGFYEDFRGRSSLSEIYSDCKRYPLSPLAGIFESAYEELSHQLRLNQSDSNPGAPAGQEEPRIKSLGGLERSLRKAAQAEMAELEQSLTWLATTGSVTPFIGLFGTVVGIINAFQGLGQGAATTIQAVAPGISEALVATAAGLFAAIPAVIFYNHFIGRLKVFGAEMDDFSAELLNTIERSFG